MLDCGVASEDSYLPVGTATAIPGHNYYVLDVLHCNLSSFDTAHLRKHSERTSDSKRVHGGSQVADLLVLKLQSEA